MAEASPSAGQSPGGAPGVVLGTKLYIPAARADIVARPRLVERLGDDPHGGFTLISAPAGFGKTTLVSEWAARSRRPVAWVSLDEEENDPVYLLEYLIAALGTVDPRLGSSVAGLVRGPQPPALRAALTHLINEIANAGGDVALVLDDYHVITAQPIHDALAFLVDRLPPQMHLVVTTRADPPLPLARWRARGRMREVRAADLRFAEAETAVFLNERMGLGLSPEDAAALGARTEGWITGLQLAAIGIKGRGDAGEFVRAFADDDRYALDYLAEEVLQHQPEPVQRFLLRTSMLGRLGGPLCDAVTGEAGGREMLDRLEKANLFVTALDGRREWYRYHHLFADLLQYRLEIDHPGLAPELHRRASEWFEAEGLPNEAIHHALRARDWPRSVRLIRAVAPEMLARRQFGLIQSWLELLPEDGLAHERELALSWGISLINRSDWDNLERFMDKVEALWQGEPDRHKLALVWSVRAFGAYARRDAARAAECAARAPGFVAPEDVIARMTSVIAAGKAAIAAGHLGEAEPPVAKALEISRATGNIFAQNALLADLGHIRTLGGRLRAAAATLGEVLEYESRQYPEHIMCAHSFLGELAREWHDLEAAARHADQALEIELQAFQNGHWDLHLERARYAVLAAWALGDRARAYEALDRGLEIAKWHRIRGANRELEALRAVLRLREGDFAAASRWAAESGLGADDEPDFEREQQHLALARVLVAEGRADRAVALLTRLLAAAEEGGRMRTAVEILVLRAVACRALGRSGGDLERSLALAAPEGYVAVFLDEGAAMAALVADEIRAHGRRWRAEAPEVLEYAAALEARFGSAVGRGADVEPDKGASVPWWYRSDPLHKRELEVLRLVADGLSNEAIATKLFLAVSTVKRHVSNIYLKLDVHSRTQAVARAREFGLFE